ncbi:MAG: relaxase/mobilization nuclease domain-containing protein [Janthinobacterium sp.]
MIAKAIKGRGFRGVLAYDLGKEQARVIDTNMTGRTPRELAQEFGAVRKLRPGLGKAVLHVSLSAAPGEQLSDAQWTQIAGRYLAGMGLDDNQYLLTRHADTRHEHMHLLVNRVRCDGGVTSDSHDYRRQESIMRAVERDFGLQQLRPSVEAPRRAASRGEIEAGLRTGIASTRQRLQQLCDAAITGCGSFTAFMQRLAAAGVALVPVTQRHDSTLAGLSYRLDGVLMKGSDLGRGYSPMGLAKRGVHYDKERDLAAVGHCREHGAAGRAGVQDGAAAPGEAGQRRGAGGDPGAAGAGDGGVDGRDAPDDAAAGPRWHAPGGTVPAPDRGGDERLAQRGTGGARERPGNRLQQPFAVAAPVSAGCAGGHDDGAARQRIVALSGTCPQAAERAGRAAAGRADPARDRSLEAVRGQMTALGCAQFIVRLVQARDGKQETRQWSGLELLRSLAWLKRMNARGYDVTLRPAGQHGLVLLDGLQQADLQRLDARGWQSAAVVEVQHGRFQAWIKLSRQPVAYALRHQAASRLASDLCRSGSAITVAEFGALAGLTCHASAMAEAQAARYALLQASSGTVAAAAAPCLERMAHLPDLPPPPRLSMPQGAVRKRSSGRAR